MKQITVDALKEILEAQSSDSSVDFINVCTPYEYSLKHIDGVRSVPLNEIEKHLRELSGKRIIYVHCRSGKRSKRAIERLESLGIAAELVNVEGGLIAWEASGFGTNSPQN